MTDHRPDPFDQLRNAPAPRPRDAAKAAALAAARAAFEAETEKSKIPAKGNPAARRLMSIFASFKRISIMDMRVPIGTAAIALLVLPLGWQLYSSTALSPTQSVSRPAPAPQPVEEAEPAPVDTRSEAPAVTTMPVAPEPMLESEAAPSMMRMPSAVPPPPAAPITLAQDSAMSPAYVGTSATEPTGDEFTSFDEQRLKIAAEEPVSTFSLDVDTASYSYVRRQLEDGFVPEPDAVRIEELINYFPYDYPAAPSADMPFKPTVKIFPTPWNDKTEIMAIGIRGYAPPAEAIPPSNLVFLIDTSGSMDEPDKLPLLKRSFALLLDQLSDTDTVSIVTYAGSAGVALEPTSSSDKAKILSALDELGAGGSTAGAEGIELAYRLAEQGKVDGTNRVILATDGDFNVGIDDPKALEQFISKKRQSGISLSVLGFGRGNLDDATMQALAQNGNGNASYISNFAEAKKVLVEEVGGTLHTIAQDVKVQVEFNPALVSEYRLIGYETRHLNREDFNNDAVDAGDIGAGHTVTALYEITPTGEGQVDPLRYGSETTQPAASDELAFLKIRYKLPGESVSQLIEQPVTPAVGYDDIAVAGIDAQFATAVAAFGQKLRGSAYGSDMTWAEIEALAQSARGIDEGGYRAEFVRLVRDAAMLEPDAE
ncbi:von Willebrand factor type A domain-containing protein [Devosia sp. BK]|uniref:vWA domain-containing protein n=1 Tax=Devosia sp. BK TaxID=2871706 RepID=UPI002939F33B|nr:von Willebrand factor type A domain-containing protein [Devosia sp. BK]MDV3253135.1 von Willebrand factor type A domain-containing protein [Devosia sp. BK]